MIPSFKIVCVMETTETSPVVVNGFDGHVLNRKILSAIVLLFPCFDYIMGGFIALSYLLFL